MNKQSCRNKYRALRNELSPAQIEQLSLQIANKVLEASCWNASYYHLFLPIQKLREVNTEYLLHILQGKDKSVIISKTNFETGVLRHFLLQENTTIKITEHGIPEPQSGIEIPVDMLEVVFVPLLAFDKNGNRVGYGKGFYDRFLSKCSPKATFIGLSFFPPEDTIKPTYTDVPLHMCITPERIYHFAKRNRI